jgi:copper chaperone
MQFHVQDMTCGSCVPHIKKAIASVDPAAEVTADTVARNITVTTSASQQAIEKALADDGYPATAI